MISSVFFFFFFFQPLQFKLFLSLLWALFSPENGKFIRGPFKSTELNYFFNLANSELFIATQPLDWVSNHIYSIMELHNYDK